VTAFSDRVAGAPISWGVCEVPGWGWQFDPATVLSQMQEVGLVATEFGPDGFLPDEPEAKAKTLTDKGLRAVGGFIPVVLHDPAQDPVPEIEPFVAKLERAALLRVFVQLRFGQLTTPADPLWELLTGQERLRQPQFGDLYNALLQLGIRPDVAVLNYEVQQRWAGEKEFIAEHEAMYGAAWDEAKVRTWMASNLDRQAGGGLVYDRGVTASGVAHWQPEARS